MEQGLSETQQLVTERSGQLNGVVKTIVGLEQQLEQMSDVSLISIC